MRIGPNDVDRHVFGTSLENCLLEHSEPRTDRETHRFDLVAPDVDARSLLEGECKYRDAMVERRGADLKAGLSE